MLALAALVLLGGGGAGAYFYFMKPAEAASGAAGEHAESEKAKEKAHAKKGGHGAASAFVQLDPLILPVVDRNGVSQVVSLVVVIETTDEATKTEIEHLSPRLKDAFIQDMYGVLSHETIMSGGVIQVAPLKDRLYKISNHVLGDGKATQVLLQVVQQRPI